MPSAGLNPLSEAMGFRDQELTEFTVFTAEQRSRNVRETRHHPIYNENPALYSRVRKSLAATLFVTRMFAAS